MLAIEQMEGTGISAGTERYNLLGGARVALGSEKRVYEMVQGSRSGICSCGNFVSIKSQRM